MPSSILRFIKERRSIRRYTKGTIPKRLITRILEAGRWAPSGLNNQPWRFVIIKGPSLKERLAELTESSPTIRSANLLIPVFLDKKAVYNRIKDLQAIGACIQNMLLEAHALGLGACWLGEILNRKNKVSQLLNVPLHYELMAVISLGWPKRRLYKKSRKRLERLIYKRYI